MTDELDTDLFIELQGNVFLTEKDKNGNIISQEEVDGQVVVNCLLEVLIGALKNEEKKEVIDAYSSTLAEDILEVFTHNVKKVAKKLKIKM
jgi:hypothetical protein